MQHLTRVFIFFVEESEGNVGMDHEINTALVDGGRNGWYVQSVYPMPSYAVVVLSKDVPDEVPTAAPGVRP